MFRFQKKPYHIC